MKLNSTHSIYRQLDTQCSSPQLVLLLCDGAIRFIREAKDLLKKEEWEKKGRAVESALDCLAELRKLLDFEQGGDVALNIDRAYNTLATKLSLGNLARDPEQFEQVAESLTTIRTSWNELFQKLAAEGKLRDRDIAPKTLDPVLD
jgi:flagellar protein FliS